jgi:cyclophilin family peptidyl-prolyl cis-trans isomerase
VSRDPKRARKKEARDARVAAVEAQLRRRRIARVAGVVAFLVVLAVLIGSSLREEENGPTEAAPVETAGEADGGPCPTAEDPPEPDPQQFDAPDDVLAEGVDYAAVIRTSCGGIEVDLLEDAAPENANSFAFLAQNGFYDGLTFHRVERNFVIQAGDPNGENGVPPDGPGYSVPDELPDRPSEYVFGVVGMANSGPDTGGSQFFIITYLPPEGVESEAAGLPKQYSIFGEVSEDSYEVIERIDDQRTKGGPDPVEASVPVEPVYILGIDIVER